MQDMKTPISLHCQYHIENTSVDIIITCNAQKNFIQNSILTVAIHSTNPNCTQLNPKLRPCITV